jgi:hypothetical protein
MKFMQENSKHIRQQTREMRKSASWLSHAVAQNILTKAKILHKMNKNLHTILPESLHPYCQLVNFTKNTVTLGLHSADWLIHMRQQEYTLKAYFTKNIYLHPSFKIKYVIEPKNEYSEAHKQTMAISTPIKISLKNRKYLKMVASTLRDEQLKTALLKLTID